LAGFCLVANGAYVAAGVFAGASGATDTSEMLRHGCPVWVPVAFGVTAMGLGLYLWHGLGRCFRLKGAGANVEPYAVRIVGVGLAIVVVVEILLRVAFVVGN
jgi:hypothetical protein